MPDTIDIINFTIANTGLVIASLGLLSSLLVPYTGRIFRFSFAIIFSFLTVYVISDLVSQVSLVFLGDGFQTVSYIAIFLESLFSSILIPILCAQLHFYIGKKLSKSIPFFMVIVLWCIYFILLCSTWFTPYIYYVTEDNVYHRGPCYPLLLIPVILMTLINIIITIVYKKDLSRREYLAFILYFAIPLVCEILQSVSYGLLLIVMGSTISTLVLFIFIMLDQIGAYIDQKEKNAQAYAANMALQMRPHFIYNVMMSIYYLCEQDPQKAQKVTLDFTNYLRKNFTAVAKEGTVPFTEELEHTQAYLAVEKTRFDDELIANFDTPHMNFKLPPLVLQPIVENAVKHGMSPEIEQLTITISTAKTDNGSIIRVDDTGGGFGNNKNDNPHIALNNIRTRLEMISKGTLTIESAEGVGTSVIIFIPD